jgi:phage terminase large subunit
VNWTPKQFEAFALLSDPNIKYAALLGGSRSGKSFTLAHKFRQAAVEFPGVSQYILRKTMADARDTVWQQTMLPILEHDAKAGRCKIFKQPTLCEYKSGSIIKIGGLHPAEIDKVLGGEHGRIWINEATEPSWQNVPALMTRLNARTPNRHTGKPIVSKLYADFNPTTVSHWTHKAYIRKIDPLTEKPWSNPNQWGWIRMNPTDNAANLAAGYMEILESLSPRDKDRFLYGEFGQLSGLVYDNFDPEQHVYDDLPKRGFDWYRTIDFGFTNPFACYWGAYDTADECLYIEDEWYSAKITINEHARIIKARHESLTYRDSIADHDAGDRAVLEQFGIITTPAIKDVASGINVVYDRFRRDKLKINRRCVNLISELYSYQWKESSQKTEPIKSNDHGLDAIRYLCMRIDNPTPKPVFFKAN